MLFMLSYIPPNDNPHSSDFYFLSFPMYANLYYPIHNFSMYIRVPVEPCSYKNVSKEKGGGDTLSYTVCRDLTGKFLWQFQTPRQGLHPHLPMPTHISIIDFRNFFHFVPPRSHRSLGIQDIPFSLHYFQLNSQLSNF
jgi:hypothetical protein